MFARPPPEPPARLDRMGQCRLSAMPVRTAIGLVTCYRQKEVKPAERISFSLNLLNVSFENIFYRVFKSRELEHVSKFEQAFGLRITSFGKQDAHFT